MSFGQTIGDSKSQATGNWNDSSTWLTYDSGWRSAYASEIPDGTHKVTIYYNDTVSITDTVSISSILLITGVLNTNGKLILSSNDTVTGSIGEITGTINGDVEIQRFIPSRGLRRYVFMSVPIVNATYQQIKNYTWVTSPHGTIAGFDSSATSSNSVYYWNEVDSTTANKWVAPTNINDTIGTVRGLLVYYRGSRNITNPYTFSTRPDSTLFKFRGAINTGNISIPIYYNSNNQGGANIDDNYGFNLVGNPYPAPIDWNSSYWTKAGINNTIYRRNGSTNSYGTWDGQVGINGANGIINSCESFCVKADSNQSSYGLTIREGCKSGNNNYINFFKTAPQYTTIKLIKDSFTSDETIIKYASSKTFGSDDSRKMFNTGINIVSYTSDGKIVSINDWGTLSNGDTIILSLNNTNAGNYSMVFGSYLPTGLVLVDLYTSTSYTLNTTPISITVNSTSTSYHNRFLLVYNTSTLPIRLLSISGKNKDNTDVLNWSAINITNTNYIIEHSDNGKDFTAIGNIYGKQSYSSQSYSFSNSTASDINYYRLAYDGSYSPIVVISKVIIQLNAPYPNPFTDRITLDKSLWKVYDIYGNKSLELNHNGGEVDINLPTGIYFFISDNGQSFKIVRN